MLSRSAGGFRATNSKLRSKLGWVGAVLLTSTHISAIVMPASVPRYESSTADHESSIAPSDCITQQDVVGIESPLSAIASVMRFGFHIAKMSAASSASWIDACTSAIRHRRGTKSIPLSVAQFVSAAYEDREDCLRNRLPTPRPDGRRPALRSDQPPTPRSHRCRS